MDFLNDFYSMMEPEAYGELNTVQMVCRRVYEKATSIRQARGRSGVLESMDELKKELSEVGWNERRWTEAVRVVERRSGRAADLEVVSMTTMQAIDLEYVKLVQPFKEFIGIENEDYLGAMETYRSRVVGILTEQQAGLQNVTWENATAGERARKMITARAWMKLSYFPELQIPTPILTTNVIEDLQTTLDPYEKAIKEVSE
jgi:hypothetical protein